MYEFLRNLISNQLYAIAAVLLIWLILFVMLVKIRKIKSHVWVRLEYIWLAIGFLAVLTIIEENKKEFSRQNLGYVETWIDRDYESILRTAGAQYHCVQYNHNKEIFNTNEFDSIQNRQDVICLWTKEVYSYVDSCFKDNKPALAKIPELTIPNAEQANVYEWIMKSTSSLNENVKKRDELKTILDSTTWSEFKYGFGVILLFMAFGLRLTITSYKVRKEKTRHNRVDGSASNH